MKKHAYIISSVAAAALCASCQIASLEPVETPAEAGFTKTFTAGMGVDSKVTLLDSNHLLWEEGDQIMVLDAKGTMNTNSGKEIINYRLTGFEMSSLVDQTATFSGTLTNEQETYYAFYPADFDNYFNPETMWFERQVSSVQNLHADSGVDKAAITMLGQGSTSLQFTLVDGLLNFKIAETSATIDQLRFTFPGSKMFGGPVRIEIPSGKTTRDGSYTMSDVLEVNVGYVTHRTSFAAGKDYYISVPEGTYGPIMIEAISYLPDGSPMTLGSISSSSTIKVKANTVSSLGTLSFYDESNKQYNIKEWKKSANLEVADANNQARTAAGAINYRMNELDRRNSCMQQIIAAVLAENSTLSTSQEAILNEARGFDYSTAGESIRSFINEANDFATRKEQFSETLAAADDNVTWDVLSELASLKDDFINSTLEYITNCTYRDIYDVDFIETRLETLISNLEQAFPSFKMVEVSDLKNEMYAILAIAGNKHSSYLKTEEATMAAISAKADETNAILASIKPSSSSQAAMVAQLEQRMKEIAYYIYVANMQVAASDKDIEADLASMYARLAAQADYVAASEYDQLQDEYYNAAVQLAATIESNHSAIMGRADELAAALEEVRNQLFAIL